MEDRGGSTFRHKSLGRLYNLIETAKVNCIEPCAYLRHVVTELPKAETLADVEAVLPCKIYLPRRP